MIERVDDFEAEASGCMDGCMDGRDLDVEREFSTMVTSRGCWAGHTTVVL